MLGRYLFWPTGTRPAPKLAFCASPSRTRPQIRAPYAPGTLFIIDLGGGLGHSGMVIESGDGRLVTVEGNTNDNGSRNGIGVFRRAARKITDINKGFIDYGGF